MLNAALRALILMKLQKLLNPSLGSEEGTNTKTWKDKNQKSDFNKASEGQIQVMNSRLLLESSLSAGVWEGKPSFVKCDGGAVCVFFGLKSIRIQRRIGNDWHRDKMRKLKQVRH